MVNYGFLKKLLVIGEKHLLQELTAYVDLALKSNAMLKDSLEAGGDKIKSGYEAIKQYEKEADGLTMRYRHEISNGAISSTMLGSFSDLVEKCDSILDDSYFIIRELKRMLLASASLSVNEKPIMTESYRNFVKMLDHENTALTYVNTMLTASSIETMREELRKIEDLEEKVDDLKDSVIDSLYAKSSTLSYVSFSHLLDMAHKIDDLLDHCEDIADLILTITTAVTK
ncbi:MAG: DUF47 family protein [Candidatus Thermoplasmatota archaeon]|nr:DUF47 family protein [Candidatus Thermoplasmatota archaeon]MCL5786009.1 DUF47 family protein [Candidatus Thermoplasmatota archaeon]